MRDSAGIRIVENLTPVWSDTNEWRLGDEPFVTIGEGANPNQQLYEVTGALRLDDGRLVIANGGTHEIKFYGSEGTWLFDRGGEGSGPGEFRHLTWLSRYQADSLIVFDRQARRWTVLDSSGNSGSSSTFEQGLVISPTAVMEDGTILTPVPYPLRPPAEGEIHRGTFAVARTDMMANRFDTVLTLRGIEAYREGRFPTTIPFARSSHVAARGSIIYSADTEKYVIRRHDAGGNLLALLTRPHEPRPVSDDDLAAYRQHRMANLPERMLELMGPALEAAPGPPTMPVMGDLEIDRTGNLWVEDYQPAIVEGPNEWSVFDVDGRWLGSVEVPPRFTMLDIGDDYVLGLQRSEMDVELVVLYELAKP